MHRFWIPALVLGALASCGDDNRQATALETQVTAPDTQVAASAGNALASGPWVTGQAASTLPFRAIALMLAADSAPVSTPTVPTTRASAITGPPSSMEGINTHSEIFGTNSNPNMITLGPKLGIPPEKAGYATHYGTTVELGARGIPVLAPIDMVFVGFSNTSAEYRIQDGQKQTPYDDLMLIFESNSPDWPGMIVIAYHLFSSPLLPGHRQDVACSAGGEWGTYQQVQGHVFYPYDDYIVIDKGNAAPCKALLGYTVKRGELIGFTGSVGTHSFVDICFKVPDTSENPTVQKGNRYLHWVQASSFFYWKSYTPDASFPSGVLAYPFETDGYQLPAEQHDVNFKYIAKP